jgi:hypothetical protein
MKSPVASFSKHVPMAMTAESCLNIVRVITGSEDLSLADFPEGN